MTPPLLVTRRSLLTTTGLGLPLLGLSTTTTAAAPDAVLDVIATELAALLQRATTGHAPTVDQLRAAASTYRIVDAVAGAHDLKRHLKKVRAVEVDAAVTNRLARQLRAHGLAVTGDELLRRHLDARGRGIDVDALAAQALPAIHSGQILAAVPAAFDAFATTLAQAGVVGGATFRDGLHGPAIDLQTRQTMPSLCSWFSTYGSRWSYLLTVTAFGLGFIPELAAVALAYGVGALFFDSAMFGCAEWW